MSKRARKIIAGLVATLTLCVALGSVIVAYPTFYTGRIYPGVSVQDVQVGGLTVEEATTLLTSHLSAPSAQVIELQGSTHSWKLDWADVGREIAWAQTAGSAYQVARRGTWHERVLSAWRVRFHGSTIEPSVDPADPERVRVLLDTIAPQVHVPPTDAALHIDPEGVTCVPSTPGRALDVETTTEKVMAALNSGVAEVKIATVPVPPTVRDPEPGCTHARSLLSQPFTLIANDPLTHHQADELTKPHFQAQPEQVATWLQAVASSNRMVLQMERPRVQIWLLEIAPQLEPELILDVEETLKRALAALRAGEHQAQAAIRHPETTYVVQPGDTLFDIAYSHGFPQWRLEEANPDVRPGELLIGMELTIPSIDVLFPEPLVPGKHIEIDLPEQRLRAYENDELVYEFTCSSGMTSTPTIAGQFQVLFKEPKAHAQRWSLEMPYFMAIYYEGPDFANGIHELPIRSNGQRLWASVLGWPASYGCIILDVGDAEKLYHWAPLGTLVHIEGVAPGTPGVQQASSDR